MKKLLFISLFMSSTFSFVYAQFTSFGAGAALSSGYHFHNMTFDENRSSHIALSVKGIYKIKDPLHISSSLTIFYPNTTQIISSETTVSTFMIDIDGHYIFNRLESLETYGIAGLNILFAHKKEATGFTVFKESDNPIGINLGIGTYFKLSENFDLFGEVKYIFSKYDQFMANAGILYKIKWMKAN